MPSGASSSRRLALALAGVVTALGAGACSLQSAAKSQTLRFETQLAATSDIRLSPGVSVGAQLVFTEMVFQPTGGSVAIGRAQGSCTRTQPGNGAVYECLITFILPAGQIYAEAASSHEGPSLGVVTGGTGAYSGVRGTFQIRATGTPKVSLTFELTS